MALDDDIRIMADQPLLGLLPREALRLLAFAAETRLLRAGDILFRKDERADAAYIIVKGAVALDQRDDGSPALQVVGPGHLLGETALFAEVQRPATAIAREMTNLMKINRPVMARVLAEFPDAAVAVHQELSGRIRRLSSELESVRRHLGAIEG